MVNQPPVEITVLPEDLDYLLQGGPSALYLENYCILDHAIARHFATPSHKVYTGITHCTVNTDPYTIGYAERYTISPNLSAIVYAYDTMVDHYLKTHKLDLTELASLLPATGTLTK